MPPLTARQHQGIHGEGFIFALASSAGLLVSRPVWDVDGIDWMISYPGLGARARSPKIEVQVKTWSRPVGDAEAWRYRLRAGHYNALAGGDHQVPRYLLLITVPPQPTAYATCHDEAMSLRHCAYWLSLADRPTLPPEATGSVAVAVPKANVLTTIVLNALVTGAAMAVAS